MEQAVGLGYSACYARLGGVWRRFPLVGSRAGTVDWCVERRDSSLSPPQLVGGQPKAWRGDGGLHVRLGVVRPPTLPVSWRGIRLQLMCWKPG